MAARQYRSTVEAKTLSSAINSSVTTITLNSVTTLPSSYPYTLVIDPDKSTEEIITVESSAGGSVLNVTRGQDLTSAQAHDAAAIVKHMITARDLQEPHNHIDASSSVHGLTTAGPGGISGGTVVGTSAQQTLTNKTLTSPTISSPTISGTITGAVVTSANIVDGTITGTDIASGTVTSTNILDGTIVNADINASAAIAPSKIAGTAIVANDTSYLLPVGMIAPYASATTAPTGWLLCAGQAVSRTTYASLFAVVSTAFGGGDGSTTFNVPDLRGRVVAGIDNMNGTDAGRLDLTNTRGITGGSQNVTLTEAQMPVHSHGNTVTFSGDGAHTHDVNGSSSGTNDHDHGAGSYTETAAQGIGSDGAPSVGASILSGAATTSGSGHSHSVSVSIANAGGSSGTTQAHSNLQPTMVLNYIIKH